MLIVCPSCASRYSIDDDKIGASGRTVRCASCRTGFFVSLADDRTPDQRPAPAAPESAPVNATQPPPGRTDDIAASDLAASDVAARSLADMEKDDAAETGPPPEPPRDLDQASLDALFEAEQAIAELEADLSAVGAEPHVAEAPPAAAGWRWFLPGGGGKAAKSEALSARRETRAGKPAARSTARPKPGSTARRPSPLVTVKGPAGLALAGVLLLVGFVMQREAVVRVFPASAGLFSTVGLTVNLSGLEFADVRSVRLSEGEARFLVVEGGVRSVHGETLRVPLIEVRLSGEDGRTLYTWTTEPPRKSLGPGEALHFRTRLATPPEAGKNVEVRFTDRQQNAKAGS